MDPMKQIRLRAGRINKRIEKAQKELLDLQSSCPHTNHTKKHGANTGNYDPSADCYWTDFKCPDCGKWWRVKGSV